MDPEAHIIKEESAVSKSSKITHIKNTLSAAGAYCIRDNPFGMHTVIFQKNFQVHNLALNVNAGSGYCAQLKC